MEFPKSIKKCEELLCALEAHIHFLKTGDKSVLHVTPSGNDYNGDLNCIRILDDVRLDMLPGSDGSPNKYKVIKDGTPVALLEEYMGNSGRSDKVACEYITELPGCEIIWENRERPEDEDE